MKLVKVDEFLTKFFVKNSNYDIEIKTFYKIADDKNSKEQKYLISFDYKNLPFYTTCILKGLEEQHITCDTDINNWIGIFERLCNGTEWLVSAQSFIAESVANRSHMSCFNEHSFNYSHRRSVSHKLEQRISRYVNKKKMDLGSDFSFEDVYHYCINSHSMIKSA